MPQKSRYSKRLKRPSTKKMTWAQQKKLQAFREAQRRENIQLFNLVFEGLDKSDPASFVLVRKACLRAFEDSHTEHFNRRLARLQKNWVIFEDVFGSLQQSHPLRFHKALEKFLRRAAFWKAEAAEHYCQKLSGKYSAH